MSENCKLVLENSLQVFFFDHLQEMNKKSLRPLSQETIFYSSIVMDNFGTSANFFERDNDRVREKILGIKLLESSMLPKEKQKAALKDIGDTSLFVCGFFADSFNKKIVDINYYENIGRTAYSRLNSYFPECYNIPSFYKRLSTQFSEVTLLMSLVAKKYSAESDPDMPWLILDKKKVS